jgi:hypothetical protein
VPTFDAIQRFWADYRRLAPAERERFLRARDLFVDDLRAAAGFRKSLRVKGFRGEPGVFEMTWAGNGRALFCYGESELDGEPHIIWLRVGTHDIFDRP